MFVQLYFLVIICHINAVRKNHSCHTWKNHKNFHLVHFEDDCGRHKMLDKETIGSRILNGVQVRGGYLPWMAFVEVKSGHKRRRCAGSVINDRYVLTAAHCLELKKYPIPTVKLGRYRVDKFLREDLAVTYDVESFIKHHSYDPSTKENDIALLRLKKTISIKTPYINYICLPASCNWHYKSLRGENATVAGWGMISYDEDGEFLKEAKLRISKCRKEEKSDFYGKGKLCSKSRNEMACRGDSGAPVLLNEYNQAYQIGVLITGKGNCTAGNRLANTFTKVTTFISWILNNIEP